MAQQHKLKVNINFVAQVSSAEPSLTSMGLPYDVINLPDVQTLGQSYLNRRYAPEMVTPLPFKNQDRDSVTINSQAPTPESNFTEVKGGYDGKTKVLTHTPPAESLIASIEDRDDAQTTFRAPPPTPGPKMISMQQSYDVINLPDVDNLDSSYRSSRCAP